MKYENWGFGGALVHHIYAGKVEGVEASMKQKQRDRDCSPRLSSFSHFPGRPDCPAIELGPSDSSLMSSPFVYTG